MSITATPSLQNLKRALNLAEQIQKLETELESLLGGQKSSAIMAAVATAAPSTAGAKAPKKRKRKGKRTMSPEARERIAAAQRARWAKAKK